MYPKWKYHKSEEPLLIVDAEEEKALGKGWEESPAAFGKKEELAPVVEAEPKTPADKIRQKRTKEAQASLVSKGSEESSE